MRIAVLACCLLVCAAEAGAQTLTDERVWTGVTFLERGSADDPWRWSIESFVRSREGVSEVDVFAVRPTLIYAVTSHSAVGVGYAVAPSFPASGGTSIEQRVFGQYTWTGPTAGGTLALRTRLESRFIEGNSGPLGRLRQQVRFSRPIRKGSRLSAVVYDEILFHLNDTTKNARGVDQNRAFGGAGVVLPGAARFEAGYVHQWYPGHRGAPDRVNHVLSSALVVNF